MFALLLALSLSASRSSSAWLSTIGRQDSSMISPMKWSRYRSYIAKKIGRVWWTKDGPLDLTPSYLPGRDRWNYDMHFMNLKTICCACRWSGKPGHYGTLGSLVAGVHCPNCGKLDTLHVFHPHIRVPRKNAGKKKWREFLSLTSFSSAAKKVFWENYNA